MFPEEIYGKNHMCVIFIIILKHTSLKKTRGRVLCWAKCWVRSAPTRGESLEEEIHASHQEFQCEDFGSKNSQTSYQVNLEKFLQHSGHSSQYWNNTPGERSQGSSIFLKQKPWSPSRLENPLQGIPGSCHPSLFLLAQQVTISWATEKKIDHHNLLLNHWRGGRKGLHIRDPLKNAIHSATHKSTQNHAENRHKRTTQKGWDTWTPKTITTKFVWQFN